MKFRYGLGMVAALILSALSADAQVAGRLSGSVVDQTGAAIPAATVKVYVPGGSEPVLTGETNEAGLFSFVALQPGTYDVVIAAPGFGNTAVRAVRIDPLQERGLGAIKLEVQSATTSVEVAADVQTVQLNNAENSTTITAQQVTNLPVLGRQVGTLFQTQTGVVAGTNVTSVNGLPSSFTNVTLDGINIQDNYQRVNGLDYYPMRTTIDQVAEITVSSSNEGASLGGGAASQLTLATKSGTNTYHGSVYWFNRNNATAANDWFNDKFGLGKPFLNLNQPGAALGGHIIKDKLFFYVNYELFRNTTQTPEDFQVLTDSAKNGIFTYKDAAGNTFTKQMQSLRSFALDPTVQSLIKQLPTANDFLTGDGLNTAGYRFNAQSNENRDQFVGRGDYYINAKHSISGTFNYINNPTLRPDAGSFFTTTPPVSNTIKDKLLSLSWRWTASPTLTNELRGGFMRAVTGFFDSNKYPASIVSAGLFVNPVNTFLNQGRDTNTYHLQDNATWIRNRHEISFGFQAMLVNARPWNDGGIIPTYTLGISASNTQSIQAAELPGVRTTDLSTANSLYAVLAGIISSDSQTFNVTSANSGFVPGANNNRHINWSNYAGYVQDKWKLRDNLTVNAGLRYEYWKPVDEKDGLYLAATVQNGNPVASILDPNATLNFIGGPSGRSFYKADANNFAPNVGFAWDPFRKNKTSIRGGYMMAYVNQNLMASMTSFLGSNQGLSFTTSQTNLSSVLSAAPTVPAPTYKVPRTLADNYALNPTGTLAMPDPNLATPYIHQWTIGIEHEYNGTIFSAKYVGNKGSSLLRGVDYNQVLYNANGFLADFQRAQANLNNTGSAAYNASLPGSQQLTVFPLLTGGGTLTNSTILNYIRTGQVGELANTYQTNHLNGSVNFFPNPNLQSAYLMVNSASSIYHSLQAEVTRRTRAGLLLQASYTFSKDLSNLSNDSSNDAEPLLDNANPSLEWARSAFDETHQLKANYYWELPYGKGKHWSGSRLTNAVLGGWALSGIWSYHSGSPYSILSGYGTLNRAGRSTNTNTASILGMNGSTLKGLTDHVFMTGNGPYFISPSIINVNSDGRGASQAGTAPFAGQIFYNPAAGAVGNLQRRMFDSPWQWSWDMSVKKAIAITERHSVDLKFDITNWMNHPTFYVYPSQGAYGTSTGFSINGTTFGKLQSMNYSPRVLQVGAYYRF